MKRPAVSVICCLAVVAFLLMTSAKCADEVTYSIIENRTPGYYIGNIAQDSNVTQNVSESVTYRFYEDNQFTKYFVIDNTNGNLNTSATVVDHEELCSFPNCQMTFEVSVIGKLFFDIVDVTVNILDENDNAPIFTNAKDVINISEDAEVSLVYDIATASDADMLENNTIQGYMLVPSSDKFSLVGVKNSNDFVLKLKVETNLDRETQDNYNLELLVFDSGKPSAMTSTHSFVVNVTDFNDNSPVFDSKEYKVTVNETIIPNTVILTVSAKDKDSGDNGRVSFYIKRQSNVDTIERFFKVNKDTGDISVISELRHESAEMYEFIVEAMDNGISPLTNETTVKVNVNDVENNAPAIVIKLFKPGNIDYVDVEENQPTGFFIAHVDVTDNDKGDSGKYSCNITNSVFRLETFQNRGFKVIASGQLDRETVAMHNVTVLCHDYGIPPKYSSKTFFVRVTDVNDNDPEFYKPVYLVSKNENMKGEVVTRVSARDFDAGNNGTVEYLLENSNGDLSIDNSTGVVKMETDLDREEMDIRVFRVLAVDKGQARRTGTATVSLTLIDVNDNAPVIVPTRPEFKIAENLVANTTVGLIHAEDRDIGDNAEFDFSFAPLQTPLPFDILPNGEIRTKQTLDREQHSRYDIPVKVTDHGNPALSSTQSVTIFVTDENDNVPIVTFPNDSNNTVQFLYQMGGYNVVTTISAHDTDAGANGTLVFSIIGGNDENIFEIDPELGELSIINYIDIKEDQTVTLTIEVKDRGTSPKSVRVNLNVELIYTNGTGAKAIQGDSNNKYIIISVVVIITTIAVAVAIIVVILFLRNADRRKHHEDLGARYSDSGISSGSDSHPPDAEVSGKEEGQGGRKKKEVSFSLQFSLDGIDGGKNEESNTEEYDKARYYDGPPSSVPSHGPPMYSVQNQEKIDSHMKALKLQQYLWEAKTRVWENTPEVRQLPLGDSESETSRDTVTCDSGRGGSEEDVSTASPVNEDKSVFGSLDSRSQRHVTFLPQPYYHSNLSTSSVRESTPIHQAPGSHRPHQAPGSHRPQSYKYSNPDLQLHNKLAIKNFTNPTYSAQNSHSSYPNQMPHLELWRDGYYQGGMPARPRHDSGSSFRSNEDDGGSTTTSGSYTLDQNDIDVTDMYGHHGDLVV